MPACLYLCGDASTDVSSASSVPAAQPCARAGGLASRSEESIPGEPGPLWKWEILSTVHKTKCEGEFHSALGRLGEKMAVIWGGAQPFASTVFIPRQAPCSRGWTERVLGCRVIFLPLPADPRCLPCLQSSSLWDTQGVTHPQQCPDCGGAGLLKLELCFPYPDSADEPGSVAQTC